MKKLFGFVMVGSNNLIKSSKFYDAIFISLEIKKVKTTENTVLHNNKPKTIIPKIFFIYLELHLAQILLPSGSRI